MSFMVIGRVKEDSKRYSVSGPRDSVILDCGCGALGAASTGRDTELDARFRPGSIRPGIDMLGRCCS